MSYLSEEDFAEILDTVEVLPISSKKSSNLTQYFFDVGIAKEYETFIMNDALRLDALGISKTFVMIHRKTNELIGYFTLSADTVKLVNEEKEGTDLKVVPFMTLPALKVGKLAINKALSETARRKGYGSFALELANTHAYEVLESGVACRFLTVDADIEYYPDTPIFYEKNGFKYNQSKKRRASDRTISMRRDIFA